MSEILEQAVFTGTAVVGGAAEGEILADTTELSFWGGIDPETGEVIDRHHPLRGQHITDRILVIPGGRGSCSGSGVLLELLLNGRGPAALVLWNSRSGSITLFTMQYVAREESPIRYSFCREDLFDRHWCIGAVSTYSKRGTRIAVSDHARETGIGLMRFGLFKSTPTPPRRRLERQGEFGQRVTGESYYQRELDRIAGGRTTDGHEFERTAEIVLDDRNRHDRNAVRIDIDKTTVGYLSRADARQYREWLRNQRYPEHVIMECTALITGGWDHGRNDRGAYEVRLDLPPLDIYWTK